MAERGDQRMGRDQNEVRKLFLKRKAGSMNAEQRKAAADIGLIASDPLEQSGENERTAKASFSKHLHLGSSRPHAADGAEEQYGRRQREARAGGGRHVEPELQETLRSEPLPDLNPQRVTEPEPEPESKPPPPGPFTTSELIPDSVHRQVVQRGIFTRNIVIDRAGRGQNGWRAAKGLRPEPLIYTEEEALHPCGRGEVWYQPDASIDLWYAVRSRAEMGLPARSPHSIDKLAFQARAARDGLTDQKLLSWIERDYPGPADMPTGTACIGHQHLGALKHIAIYNEINERDVSNGFVTHGRAFPEMWPTRVDCTNLVMQNGKGRVTIDKRINLSSSRHPEPLNSYNDYINLDDWRAQYGPLRLFKASAFCRGAAILMTACVDSAVSRVKFGKWDIGTFFRMHQKRLEYVALSGRLNAMGYGHDWRSNFGERDAMDANCGTSDAVAFFTRREFRRLEEEYPVRDVPVMLWLNDRLRLSQQTGAGSDQIHRWAVTFLFGFFVDDANLAVINEPLWRRDGTMLRAPDGAGSWAQQERADLYLAASRGIALELGYDVPDKKFFSMRLDLECIGTGVDLGASGSLAEAHRYLPDDKRLRYRGEMIRIEKEASKLPNGTIAVDRSDLNSLIHKLIHASETRVLGRVNLHYVRKAYREHSQRGNDLDRDAVILGAKAQREWRWWLDNLASRGDSLPLASRIDFPCSSITTLVMYTDASRELPPEHPPKSQPQRSKKWHSGFGGWTVMHSIFFYVWGVWSEAEVRAYSINTLEAAAKDKIATRFLQEAEHRGWSFTHMMSYIDNSTAEAVAENGRTQTDALATLQKERLERNLNLSLIETTERVSSVENVVADLLSRGDIEDALRFPQELDLPIVRLELTPELRYMEDIPATWN